MIDSPFRRISSAYGKNHYAVDFPFRTALKYFKFEGDLSSLGEFAGGELYDIADYIYRNAKPRQAYWSIDEKPKMAYTITMENLMVSRLSNAV